MAEWKSRNAELEYTVLPLEWQSYTPTSDNDDVDDDADGESTE